jgi:hypothetical protein
MSERELRNSEKKEFANLEKQIEELEKSQS